MFVGAFEREDLTFSYSLHLVNLCYLVGIAVDRLELEDLAKTIEVAAPICLIQGCQAKLFLCDNYHFFANNRSVLYSVQSLQESVRIRGGID